MGNSEKTVKTTLMYGFGKIKITVNAGKQIEQYDATILGPYVKLKK